MTSRFNSAAILLAAACLLQGGMAWGGVIVLHNTGVPGADATPDANYTIISGGTSPIAYIVNSPYPGWLPNQGISKWISPVPDPTFPFTGTLDNNYVYRTTFDLTGMDPTTASISGFWTVDDAGSAILLNGASTGNVAPTSGDGYNQLTPFSITSGFVSGLNTLDFHVVNFSGISGLQVQMTGTAAAQALPEPASLGILTLGGLGLLARRRVRRN